ncbi:MAG: gliding motility protein RemB [Flavobacteriaceae bacterium]|nr:gliding motility protein RemB [Flavobacteriaceae bacterium]
MRFFFFFITILFSLSVFSQAATSVQSNESLPVFENCEVTEDEKKCFNSELFKLLKANFQLPASFEENNREERVVVIFDVNKKGVFNVIYVESKFAEVIDSIHSAFNKLPAIHPATYNSRPTDFQMRLSINLPFQDASEDLKSQDPIITAQQKLLREEYDQIQSKKFTDPQTRSNLNVQFSHELYSRMDSEMNKIGTNAHTATKPYRYSEIQKYYDFRQEREDLALDKRTWFGKKLFNENTARFEAEDYWFTVDIAADLQVGRDFEENFTTYNNTRAGIFQGGLGDKLNFYATVFESQGKFAGYYNDFARSLGPEGSELVMVPGRGLGESFRGSSFDYPVTIGYLNYDATDFLNLEFGSGNNFIGDGYRSLFLSDNASPNAYFKVETTFWKIKYTNIYQSLRNLNNRTAEGSFLPKYNAIHYLSYNVNKRLTLGLFESVMFASEPERGFDWNFVNPLLFWNMAEYSLGSRSGKSTIGLSYKYKWSDKINTYGQWLIDELAVGDVAAMDKSWRNKFGLQLGMKYYDAFKVDNLLLQLEYNQVRPYTYSHFSLTQHYTHNNQSLAHLWGANFREIMLLARYRKDRFYGHTKFIFGERGFETNSDSNPYYGSDLFGDERVRVGDNNINIGQGNRANSYYGEIEIGYLVNPTTNLKIYVNIIHREFDIAQSNLMNFDRSTTWVNFGFRTDVFNWYFDY